jgi:hypothetical protein
MTADSNPHRSATDRAREHFAHTPLMDRYLAGMRIAREVREGRAYAAARQAIIAAWELQARLPLIDPAPSPMWELRGELRTRETFSQPHPDDFPGGLPTPSEYPAHFPG